MDENRVVTVAVEVVPLDPDAYRMVDRAIDVIARSGVRYEVGPMETTMEGPLDQLLDVAKAAHRAAFEAGAERVVTIIKIGDSTTGSTIADKVAKYRS
jgi:uncharacterized protein (TIGR00106 family)